MHLFFLQKRFECGEKWPDSTHRWVVLWERGPSRWAGCCHSGQDQTGGEEQRIRRRTQEVSCFGLPTSLHMAFQCILFKDGCSSLCILACRIRAELEDAKQKVKNDNEDDVSPSYLWCMSAWYTYGLKESYLHFEPALLSLNLKKFEKSPIVIWLKKVSRV